MSACAAWEPEEVQNVPPVLRYIPVDYDRSLLTRQMLALEAQPG